MAYREAAVKVTRPQIEKALQAVKGNVREASSILGIARKNLYNRMASLGISPDSYRGVMTPSVTVTAGDTFDTSREVSRAVTGRNAVSVFSRTPNDTLKRARRARTLHNVIDGNANATAQQPEAVEVVKKLRQPRTVYFPPEIWKQVDDACFDVAPIVRAHLTHSRMLELYMEGFATFVSTFKVKPNGKKKGGA